MTLTVTLRVCRCAPQVLISNGPWVRVHVTCIKSVPGRMKDCPSVYQPLGPRRSPLTVPCRLRLVGGGFAPRLSELRPSRRASQRWRKPARPRFACSRRCWVTPSMTERIEQQAALLLSTVSRDHALERRRNEIESHRANLSAKARGSATADISAPPAVPTYGSSRIQAFLQKTEQLSAMHATIGTRSTHGPHLRSPCARHCLLIGRTRSRAFLLTLTVMACALHPCLHSIVWRSLALQDGRSRSLSA